MITITVPGTAAIHRRIGPMFFLCYIAYTAVYISRLNITAASALLEAVGTVTKAQYGLIGSVFCLVYAIGQLANGYIGDRLPAKLLISGGVLTAGICNLMIGIFPVFWSILLLWGVNGYGQSMVWGPMLRSCVSRIAPERRTLLSSLLISSVPCGSILGLALGSRMAGLYGVAACFLIPGAVTLAAGLLFLLFFRDSCGKDRSSPRPPVRTLLARRDFRQMIFPAMAHGVVKDNITLWLAVYCVDVLGADLSAFSGFLFLVPLLGFIGRLLYPAMFLACGKNENRVGVAAFLLCASASFLLLIPGTSPVLAAICLCTLSALIQIVNTSVLTIYPSTFASTGNVSFVAGVMDFFTYAGAGLSSIFFGTMIGAFGFGSMFLVWGILCAVSAALLEVIQRSRRALIVD